VKLKKASRLFLGQESFQLNFILTTQVFINIFQHILWKKEILSLQISAIYRLLFPQVALGMLMISLFQTQSGTFIELTAL